MVVNPTPQVDSILSTTDMAEELVQPSIQQDPSQATLDREYQSSLNQSSIPYALTTYFPQTNQEISIMMGDLGNPIYSS